MIQQQCVLEVQLDDTTAMCVGSTVGPAVFVRICGWSTSQISRELKAQLIDEFGSIPKKLKLYNCVGGGSSNLWIMIKNKLSLLG